MGQVTGVRGPSGRWYVDRAFGLFHPLNPIRSAFILLIEAPWFDHLILVIIAINCYVLAMSDRPESSLLHLPAAAVHHIEFYCTVLFTCELGCRAMAMGVFTSQYHSLLSDPWNRLDLVVVISAWLPLLLPSFSGYTSLRALRAFRPLRALHMLPGVKRQVDTIFKALPKIANVLMLIAVVGSAFAILGMQARTLPYLPHPPIPPASPHTSRISPYLTSLH